MTNMEDLQSMNIDELSDWLDKYGQFDSSPWMEWFDTNYCLKCEPIECQYMEAAERLGIKPFDKQSILCAYCDLEHKCKFFPDMDHTPNNKDIIRIWLESEGDTND